MQEKAANVTCGNARMKPSALALFAAAYTYKGPSGGFKALMLLVIQSEITKVGLITQR